MSQPKTIGRYRIVRLLGSGAMGDVYLAEDPNIDRELAIKTVRVVGGTPDDVADRKRRLLREAKAAGKFVHPNVVTLFDADESDGTLYLAFEYVPPGIDLAQRMTSDPPVTLRQALRWVREIAQALQFAHDSGIVHRDIKPSNVLIAEDDTAKVADFGIAKLLGPGTELTRTGSVVGSPQYMSPEQVRGETLDGRSDVFALGVVFYELLCGIRPFGGETLSTLVFEILSKEPLAVGSLRPSLPGDLVGLAHRMLAKDRNHRCGSSTEVAEAIRGLEASVPAQVLDDSAAPSNTDGTRRMATALTARSVPLPPIPTAPEATSANPTLAAAQQPTSSPTLSTSLPSRAGAAPSSNTLRNVALAVGVLGVLGVALLVGLWLAVRSLAPQMLPPALGGPEPQAESTLAESREDLSESVTAPEPEPRREDDSAEEAATHEDLRTEVAQAQSEPPPPPRVVRESSPLPLSPPPPVRRAETERAPPVRTEPQSLPVETRPTATEVVDPLVPDPEPEPGPDPEPEPEVDEELERWLAAAGRTDQEMSTGLHFRFDIKPRDLYVIVRVWPKQDEMIVKGAAVNFKDGRKGQDMTLPGSGDHLLQLLVNGEIQRSILVHASATNSQTATVRVDFR